LDPGTWISDNVWHGHRKKYKGQVIYEFGPWKIQIELHRYEIASLHKYKLLLHN
jgi:hypothetical protein